MLENKYNTEAVAKRRRKMRRPLDGLPLLRHENRDVQLTLYATSVSDGRFGQRTFSSLWPSCPSPIEGYPS